MRADTYTTYSISFIILTSGINSFMNCVSHLCESELMSEPVSHLHIITIRN